MNAGSAAPVPDLSDYECPAAAWRASGSDTDTGPAPELVAVNDDAEYFTTHLDRGLRLRRASPSEVDEANKGRNPEDIDGECDDGYVWFTLAVNRHGAISRHYISAHWSCRTEVSLATLATLCDIETGENDRPMRIFRPSSDSSEVLDLTTVPGLLGDVIDYIVATARQPNRILAMGAAVTVLGTLLGQYVGGPTMSATHLYVVALAPSGAGKEHNLGMISRLLKAAGAEARLGSGQFMSQTAVFQELLEHPACVCPIDEIGAFLKKLANPRATGHELGINSVLRQIWGKNFEPLATPKWASAASRVEMPKEINSPAMSIYGCSTPGEFFESLKSKDATNGFLNRWLLISTEVNTEAQEPERDKRQMPPALLDKLRAFFKQAESGTKREAADVRSVNGASVEPKMLPWADDAARAVYKAMMTTVRPLKDDPATGMFYARTEEMALRLATIRAAGVDMVKGVTAADMAWGLAVALSSAQQMVTAARDYMSEGIFDGHKNRLIRLLKERIVPLTMRDFARHVRELKPREIHEVVEGLLAENSIIVIPPPPREPGKTGPTSTANRYALKGA